MCLPLPFLFKETFLWLIHHKSQKEVQTQLPQKVEIFSIHFFVLFVNCLPDCFKVRKKLGVLSILYQWNWFWLWCDWQNGDKISLMANGHCAQLTTGMRQNMPGSSTGKTWLMNEAAPRKEVGCVTSSNSGTKFTAPLVALCEAWRFSASHWQAPQRLSWSSDYRVARSLRPKSDEEAPNADGAH